MRNGQLRHKIEFLAIVEEQDEMGGFSKVETLQAEAFASIFPITGNEKFISNQLYTEATAQIKCRFIPNVTTKHKIKFNDRVFDIINVQNKEERNKELFIIAKEQL